LIGRLFAASGFKNFAWRLIERVPQAIEREKAEERKGDNDQDSPRQVRLDFWRQLFVIEPVYEPNMHEHAQRVDNRPDHEQC